MQPFEGAVPCYRDKLPTHLLADKRRTSATIQNLFRLRRSDPTYDRSRWRRSRRADECVAGAEWRERSDWESCGCAEVPGLGWWAMVWE